MIKNSFFAAIIILISFTPVQAQELGKQFIVTAKSFNPAATSKSVPCNKEQKQCFLTLSFDNGETPIDIAVSLQNNEARFQFMKNRRYLPIRNDGQTLLVIPLKNGFGTAETILLDPSSLDPDRLIQKPVIKTGRRVAHLSLNVQTEAWGSQ